MTLAPNPLFPAISPAEAETLHPLNELDSNVPPNFTAAGQTLGFTSTTIQNRMVLISSVLELQDSDLFSGTNSKRLTPLGWSILRRMPPKNQKEWLDIEARVLFSKWLPQSSPDVFPVEILDEEDGLEEEGCSALVAAIDHQTSVLARRTQSSCEDAISLVVDLGDIGNSLADFLYQQGYNTGTELAQNYAEGLSLGVQHEMQSLQGRLGKGATAKSHG